MITPEIAKNITEGIIGIKPCLADKGERKGQHVKYGYRFEYSNRHICIATRRTESGITVYLNQTSVSGERFPEEMFPLSTVTDRYPVGFKGKTGDKGLSSSAARLPSINPDFNASMRISVSTPDVFQRLLDWYFSLEGVSVTKESDTSELDVKDVRPQSAIEPTVSEAEQNCVEEGNDESADSDSAGSQGYEQDPEMRSAVELYAESIAKEHYVSKGFRVRKFGKPFDLLCERDGESIHVEVKGSRTRLETVILTINEVSDAENADWQSDIFVVYQIVVERDGGKLLAGGGVARVIQKWVPAREMLAPSEFRYRLPDESQWTFLK